MTALARGLSPGLWVAMLGAAALAGAQTPQASPPVTPVPDVPGLVVVQDARDVALRPSSMGEGNYVSYKVRAAYPAERVITEIRTRLDETGWKPLPRESIIEMNPSSLQVGWRSHVIDRRGDPPAKKESYVWNAQWSNATGDIVAYTLMYESGPPAGKEGAGPDNDDLRVSASLSRKRLLPLENLPASLIVLDGARDAMATRDAAIDQVVFDGDGNIRTSQDPARSAYKTRLIYTLAASRPPAAAMESLDDRLGKLGWVEIAEEPPPFFPAEKWAASHKSGWNEQKSTLPTGLLEFKWRAQWRNPAGDTLLYVLTRREAPAAGEATVTPTALVDYHVEASLRPSTGKPRAAVSPTPTKKPRTAAAIESGVEPAYRRGDWNTLLELLRDDQSAGAPIAERYRADAAQGSALAQGIVGVLYESGIGVTKDETQAVDWFRKAAEQGDPTGQKYLGDMYRQGNGVTPDSMQAMNWYLRASDQGDGSAQAMIGVMYQRGQGVLPDQELVYMWFTVAAASLPESDRKAVLEARRRHAATMSAESIANAEKMAKEPRPTAATWHREARDLAWRAVEVDDAIWIVDTMFSKGPKGSLNLSGEDVSEKNARQVLERLRGEKRELAAGMESAGVRDVRGDYGLSLAPEDQCNLAANAKADNIRKPGRIVQKDLDVELQGEGLKGCGFVGGDVVVLKNHCGGTSPYRVIGKITDAGIEVTFWDTSSGKFCRLGTLTKITPPR